MYQSIPAVNMTSVTPGDSHILFVRPHPGFSLKSFARGPGFRSGQILPEIDKKSIGRVNFCRTFISSILLFFELAGSNLEQTLRNPSKVIWHLLFLLNESVVFVNAVKCSVQNKSRFHKTVTYLTRVDNVKAK